MNRQFDREREILRQAAEQFGREIVPLRQERDAMKALINSLTQERERITAYRDQLQATFRQAEEALQARLAELARQHGAGRPREGARDPARRRDGRADP